VLPTARPEVIYQTVEDGAVLLDTAAEIYFGLNPVGAAIWELLPPASQSLDELCAALERRYPDADPEQLRRDVEELLDDLESNGLVSRPVTTA
jgi:hypothetical protein